MTRSHPHIRLNLARARHRRTGGPIPLASDSSWRIAPGWSRGAHEVSELATTFVPDQDCDSPAAACARHSGSCGAIGTGSGGGEVRCPSPRGRRLSRADHLPTHVCRATPPNLRTQGPGSFNVDERALPTHARGGGRDDASRSVAVEHGPPGRRGVREPAPAAPSSSGPTPRAAAPTPAARRAATRAARRETLGIVAQARLDRCRWLVTLGIAVVLLVLRCQVPSSASPPSRCRRPSSAARTSRSTRRSPTRVAPQASRRVASRSRWNNDTGRGSGWGPPATSATSRWRSGSGCWLRVVVRPGLGRIICTDGHRRV